jgi:O-acetyl-ADP-ribose deacetylase (regulator of RNase III)
MIKEVSGDLLYTSAEAIAHGIAPNDHFDSGLALSLREHFPDLYKDFRTLLDIFVSRNAAMLATR